MDYLRRKLPGMEEVPDQDRDAYTNYVRTLERQGSDPAIHIEDDIILTREFVRKVHTVIGQHQDRVIQFFSIRKSDLAKGSRFDRAYMMNQCHYIPANYGPEIVRFSALWAQQHPGDNGCDTMLRDFLKSRHEPYWLHVPSLVQHRDAKSRLGPRSTKRQSPTFTDPDWP